MKNYWLCLGKWVPKELQNSLLICFLFTSKFRRLTYRYAITFESFCLCVTSALWTPLSFMLDNWYYRLLDSWERDISWIEQGKTRIKCLLWKEPRVRTLKWFDFSIMLIKIMIWDLTQIFKFLVLLLSTTQIYKAQNCHYYHSLLV